ncbi:MAG: O-antigen ligase [Segetibacter sp.]|jgi:hypothetical protein|nr:O-antigen ligase [Segetibacter sp.]
MNFVLRIFNYRFYLKEILLVFFTYLLVEEMFSWLVVPNSGIVLSYEKISSLLIACFMVFSIDKLRFYEKVYTGIFALLILKLIVESLYIYNTVFQQLTMFYILFPVIFALFIKYISRIYDLDLLEFLAKFYLVTYIVFMVFYGRGFSFSLAEIEMNDYGPFSGDGRILHSSKIYMMIIPTLWYFDKFINTQKNKFLLPLLFCFVIILIHQHRSVWSCTIFSFLIYSFLSLRVKHLTLSKFWNVAIGALLITFIAYFFVSNLLPGFIDFMADRFSEIFDPAKEDSTGKFRADQREVYFKLFLQRPIFGWTYEGFEMPNPLVDWWPEKTGQHFHEGYMEMLFYQGIVGFVFKFSLFAFVASKAFSKKITQQSIILISFCLSGLLYSFNYVLPLIFWGHMGLCLYYIEKDHAVKEEHEEEPEDVKYYEEMSHEKIEERVNVQ